MNLCGSENNKLCILDLGVKWNPYNKEIVIIAKKQKKPCESLCVHL